MPFDTLPLHFLMGGHVLSRQTLAAALPGDSVVFAHERWTIPVNSFALRAPAPICFYRLQRRIPLMATMTFPSQFIARAEITFRNKLAAALNREPGKSLMMLFVRAMSETPGTPRSNLDIARLRLPRMTITTTPRQLMLCTDKLRRKQLTATLNRYLAILRQHFLFRITAAAFGTP